MATEGVSAPTGTMPQSQVVKPDPGWSQGRVKKSKKALIIATLRIFFYLWEAGKIVFRKKSRIASHESPSYGAKVECNRALQGSKLFASTWSSLWNVMPRGKVQRSDWKMMMKLKQIYINMNNQFTDHLWKMNTWKGCWRRSLLLLQRRRSRECQGAGKSGRTATVPFVGKCLQTVKMLGIPRKSLTWGELVHSHDERYQSVIKRYNMRLQLYRKLPLRQISRLWGKFNDVELPMWLRSPAIRLYIWLFNCCLEEAAVQDLRQYPSVGKFFRRRLRPGVRPIDSLPLTSPCDGTVLHCGLVKDNTLEQVKGVIYSVKGFLGPLNHSESSESTSESPYVKDSQNKLLHKEREEDVKYSELLLTKATNRLYQCIIYLAPGDYHRFHSPADWNIYHRRHFPGELFSVNPSIARWLQGLFSFNERVVYSGRWCHGYMSMTPVGATNVGSIHVYHDQDLSTNVERTWPTGCYHDKSFVNTDDGVMMSKGQIFGHFSLGSTIVLLFEAPRNFKFSVKPGQKVKYGQGVGWCKQRTNKSIKAKAQAFKCG